MKHVFWLLVAINLSLLAYFNLGYIMPSKPQIKALEINPEKIQLLTPNEIKALPKKTAVAPATPQPIPVTTACYEWGIFSNENLTDAQTAVSQLALQTTVRNENSKQAKRFWVYRPPLKSTYDAQQKAAEIKALGVEDLFVVQEVKFKNAISFGIFEDEQLALKLVSELKAKGVRDVSKALRNQGDSHSSLILSNVGEKEVLALEKLQPDFPDAKLKKISCNP